MVELQNQVKSAMAYPLFMMVFAVGIVGMISFFILPNLISAFGGNYEPEGTMAILLKMNDILKNHWPILLVLLLALLIGGFFFFKSKYGNIVKETLDSSGQKPKKHDGYGEIHTDDGCSCSKRCGSSYSSGTCRRGFSKP